MISPHAAAVVAGPSDAAAHTMSLSAGRSSLLQNDRYSSESPPSFLTSTTRTEGATANISAATASLPFLPLPSPPSSLTPAAELLVTLSLPSALAASPSSLDITPLAGSFVANRIPSSRFSSCSKSGERSKPWESDMRWNALRLSGTSMSFFGDGPGGSGGGGSRAGRGLPAEVFLNQGVSTIIETVIRVLGFGSRSLVTRRRASGENQGGHLKSPRTQMKTQIERHENSILKQENDKLRAENMQIKEAMRNPMCGNCGGPAMLGEVSLEEQHLRIENARLKDELDRVCSLAGKFLGRPMPPSLGSALPLSSLDLAVGNNGFAAALGMVAPTLSAVPDFVSAGGSSPLGSVVTAPPGRTTMGGVDRSVERSMYLELALVAMDELVKMAQMEEPLWVGGGLEGGKEVLNYDEYLRAFPRCIGEKPVEFVSEATRETGMVIVNSMALVETLMDATRWMDMFPCMIARTTMTDIVSTGVAGTRNGALQLMHAELQVLSPLVPIREVNFLRFCKQHAEGVWAVVDVSVDGIREFPQPGESNMGCRRLPSGCLVQDMPNGYSKVTWVEHAEYNEAMVHRMYRPLLRSGIGLGARRWVATLQRQCECLAILMSSSISSRDHTAITAGGRRSMLKLAQRMTDNFCAGVCASSSHKWNKLNRPESIGEDVRVMTRQSLDDPGEPPGVVLSAATSVWMPLSPQRIFDFLRDERLRSQWDILSNGGPMQEMAHIAKGQDHGNAVSLLRASAVSANQSSMLILQETCTDASGSLVVYAPVDIPAMHLVMNGGDSAYVALLPSGFAIVPDGDGPGQLAAASEKSDGRRAGGGSLLTVAFQILVNSLPSAKLTVESVETVNNLITCTVQKIKVALNLENIV